MISKIKIIAVIIFISLNAQAQDINEKVCSNFDAEIINSENFQWRILNKKLPEKEKIFFNVYWKFIKVGEAILEIREIAEINGRRAYHIYSTAKTLSLLDTFYKVRDENQSWIDIESLCSLKFLADIREGNWIKKQKIDFDHINAKYILEEEGEFTVGDTKRWVQDVLSGLYYFRTIDLEVGDEYLFDAHADKNTWILKTKVTGRETIKTKAGVFDCFILEPAMRENTGIFKAKGGLKVWITADNKRIPVKLITKIPIGSIIAEIYLYQDINKLKEEESGTTEND
ncbi:MAG: DUF3108 domain-containing protein [Endomicrobiaceae bacterium]|nr:DUF3108 domain-containing protein [Endomicrobiaceae bacterium]